MKQTESNNVESNKKKFGTQLLVAGTAACIADVASFPFDTAKVRLQLQGESSGAIVSRASAITKNFHLPLAISTSNGAFISAEFPVEATHTSNTPQLKQQYRGLFGTISTIVRQEGPRALYNGLSAGLQRQMVFASVRLGMYDSVKSIYQNVIHERPDGFQVLTRVMAGITTGSMAVIVGQPTEVAKVRFQAQKRMVGSTAKLQYTSTLATYRKIGSEEGICGLWKGAIPNMGRNAVVNVAEIVVYDIVKDCLLTYGKMRDNIYCHFSAAVIAGTVDILCLLIYQRTTFLTKFKVIIFLIKLNRILSYSMRIACRCH